MPIPILIGVAAVATGLYGAKKGYDAKCDFDDADRINDEAESIYDNANKKLELTRNSTQETLESLGKRKYELYEASIIPFIDSYAKITNVPDNTFKSKNEKISKNEELNLEEISLELKELVGGGIAALGSGGLVGLASYGGVGMLGTTAGGTAIGSLSGAAATNATLAWLGGGSLASGGLGMAGGMAVLGGIVAGPVLAVGGMMLSSKAEAAKEDAYTNLSKAKLAVEEMKTAVVKTKAIQKRVIELMNVTNEINKYFLPYLSSLQYLVLGNTDWNTYSQKDKEMVIKTYLLAKTLLNLLEVNLLTKKGNLTRKSKRMTKEANTLLIEHGQKEK